MDWWTAGAKILGAVGGNLIGNAMDRDHDEKSMDNRWSYMEGKGLTPQEIAGSGAAGGSPTSSGGNVLGNQAGEVARIKMQQQYDEKQRDIDRQITLRGQDTQLAQTQVAADASVQSSGISAGASRYSTDASERIAQGRLALEQDRFSSIDLPKGLNDIATSTPAWKRQQLLATMGVDNIIATALAGARGIDVMDPDTLEKMSDVEFQNLVRDIYGMQSNLFGETAGITKIIGDGVRDLGATLGMTGSGPGPMLGSPAPSSASSSVRLQNR